MSPALAIRHHLHGFLDIIKDDGSEITATFDETADEHDLFVTVDGRRFLVSVIELESDDVE